MNGIRSDEAKADLVLIQGLTELTGLGLSVVNISSLDALDLRGLTKLESLGLENTQLPDLSSIKGPLPSVQKLFVRGHSTWTSFQGIDAFPILKVLYRGGTGISLNPDFVKALDDVKSRGIQIEN